MTAHHTARGVTKPRGCGFRAIMERIVRLTTPIITDDHVQTLHHLQQHFNTDVATGNHMKYIMNKLLDDIFMFLMYFQKEGTDLSHFCTY